MEEVVEEMSDIPLFNVNELNNNENIQMSDDYSENIHSENVNINMDFIQPNSNNQNLGNNNNSNNQNQQNNNNN